MFNIPKLEMNRTLKASRKFAKTSANYFTKLAVPPALTPAEAHVNKALVLLEADRSVSSEC